MKTPKTRSDRQYSPRMCVFCNAHLPCRLERFVMKQGDKLITYYHHGSCLQFALSAGNLIALTIARELKRRRDDATAQRKRDIEEGNQLINELYHAEKGKEGQT